MTKVITMATKTVEHMTVISSAHTVASSVTWLHCHRWRLSRWISCYFLRRKLYALFFCAPPVGQSMKRTEGKRIVLSWEEQRVTSARVFTAFPSALFVLTFPCDCWSSLSPAPHPPALLWRGPWSSTCVTPASSWETLRSSLDWAQRRRSGWRSSRQRRFDPF